MALCPLCLTFICRKRSWATSRVIVGYHTGDVVHHQATTSNTTQLQQKEQKQDAPEAVTVVIAGSSSGHTHTGSPAVGHSSYTGHLPNHHINDTAHYITTHHHYVLSHRQEAENDTMTQLTHVIPALHTTCTDCRPHMDSEKPPSHYQKAQEITKIRNSLWRNHNSPTPQATTKVINSVNGFNTTKCYCTRYIHVKKFIVYLP